MTKKFWHSIHSLRDHLLIATPSLQDRRLSHTVAYVVEYNDDGAIAVVINQPMELRLGEMLRQLGLASNDAQINNAPVLLGGPIGKEHGIVLHEPFNQSAANKHNRKKEDGTIHLTTSLSREMLELIATGKGPKRKLISLGYTGWAPGQLDEEIMGNDWIIAPADPKIIFDTPFENRWQAAADLVGVKFDCLIHQAGHA